MPLSTYIPTERIRNMSRKQLIDTLAHRIVEEDRQNPPLLPKFERLIARCMIRWNMWYWPTSAIRLMTLLYLRGRVK